MNIIIKKIDENVLKNIKGIHTDNIKKFDL